MPLLALLFLVTAALYASVGFGGGSTYNALLVVAGTDYAILPAIALACNIVVVAGGSWRFGRAQHIPWRAAWPFFLLSVPMAFVGGRLPVPELLFVGLLGASLLVASLTLLLVAPPSADAPTTRGLPSPGAAAVGGGLGLLSGIVGIGGGIFLAPVLYFLRWGPARAIAGTSAMFILVNSVAGLAGQLAKLGGEGRIAAALDYWPLLVAVAVGGQIGSHLGVAVLPERIMRRLTGLFILLVAVRLLWRFGGELTGSEA